MADHERCPAIHEPSGTQCGFPVGHGPIRLPWLVEAVLHANPAQGVVWEPLCGAKNANEPYYECTLAKGHADARTHVDGQGGRVWSEPRSDADRAAERARDAAKVWVEEVVEARAQREATLEAIEELAFGRSHRVKDWPEDEREAFRAASDLTRSWAAVQRLRAEKILDLARGATQ